MAKTRVYTKALSNSLRDTLKEQLSAIVYPESGYCEYLAQIATVRDSVAGEFADLDGFLDDSRNERERPVAIKLVNLPTDQEIPMPPVDGGALKHIKKGKYLSENLLALVSSMFGAPYSMFCEGKGLINNLIPSRKASGDLTGLGATSDLRFHIENAALRFMTEHDCAPKALFIIGVRQDRSPPYTRLSDARLALDLLSADDRHVLASAAFKIKLPYRWRAYRCDYEAAATEFVPLVEFGSTHTVVSAAFYGDMIGETASDRAKAAAKRFEDALEQVAIDEIVAPGEMLGIDNRCTLHARTPFEASFDELGRAHRWAQRIFIADSLANFVGWHETDRPVFAPTFVPGRAN
jgi:L-asparagine oxygenase